jgi:hypothetical protein
MTNPARGGVCFGETQKTKQSLELGFFVFHVLASFGIKFHDRHFLGHGLFVFAGGVEVTGSSRGFEFNFFASAFGGHDEFLSDGSGLATGTHVGEHGVDAFFVDQTQSGAGNAQTNPTVLALHPKAAVLKVGHEAALGLVVGVRNVVANHGTFAGDFTKLGHVNTPDKQARRLNSPEPSPRQLLPRGGGDPKSTRRLQGLNALSERRNRQL